MAIVHGLTTPITIKRNKFYALTVVWSFHTARVYKPKFKPRDAARAPPALTKAASHVLFAQIFGPGHHALAAINIRTYQ